MLVYTHIPPPTPMPYSWCKLAMVGKVKAVKNADRPSIRLTYS